MIEGGLTIVWAFDALDELEERTGFVECDEELASRLVREGRAQDPAVGALLLKPITAPGEYATRVLKPAASPPPLPTSVPARSTSDETPTPAVKRGRGRPRKA